MNYEYEPDEKSDVQLQVVQIPEPHSRFERRLGALTKVPPERVVEFAKLPAEDLKREAVSVTAVLKRFAEAVVDAIERPEGADDFLRELDMKYISRDHDWRAVFEQIRSQSAGHRRHKHTLLIKYLQYLSFRKRLIEFIYARKAGLGETDEFSDLTLFPKGKGGEPGSRMPWQQEDGNVVWGGVKYVRLPLGECVELNIEKAESVKVLLAKHSFRMFGTVPPALIDQNGVMYFFREGRSTVGRHPESDLTIDGAFRDVSRAHMLVEWRDGGPLYVTDLSTRGTYVPEHCLQRLQPPVGD